MTIETFLSFWSQHNSTIIEILLALVILTTLTLAFRSFFSSGRKGVDHSSEGGALVSPELEGKLEKILEGQKQQADLVAKVAESVSNKQALLDDSEGDVDDFEIKEGAGKKTAVEASEQSQKVSEVRIKESENKVKESEAEIAQLRITLAETQQKMLEMRKDLEQAKASGNSGPAADVGEGDASLLGKIADLEARLEEYDIISQDLADLPALQAENASLKEQLEQLLKQSMLSEGAGANNTPEVAAEPEEPVETEEEYAAKATEGLVDSNDLQNLNVEEHANDLENQIDAAFALAEFEQAADALEGAETPVEEAITVSGGEADSSAGDFLITDDMMEELQSAVMEKKEEAQAAKTAKNRTPADDFPEDVLSKEDADLFDSFNKTITKKS